MTKAMRARAMMPCSTVRQDVQTHVYEEYPCDVAHALAVAHLLISYGVGM